MSAFVSLLTSAALIAESDELTGTVGAANPSIGNPPVPSLIRIEMLPSVALVTARSNLPSLLKSAAVTEISCTSPKPLNDFLVNSPVPSPNATSTPEPPGFCTPPKLGPIMAKSCLPSLLKSPPTISRIAGACVSYLRASLNAPVPSPLRIPTPVG